MNRKTFVILTVILLAAAAIGWRLANSPPEKPAPAVVEPRVSSSNHTVPMVSSSAPLGTPAASGWTAPTGDPVQRYHEAKNTAERIQVISDFITLGHERNVFMLQEALKDSDPKVRMLALESAASMLTPEMAREVYRVSGRSNDPDIRTMTWSFLAPHPMENRVAVYGEVLQKGPDVAVEETLSEMGRTPEMPMFDTLLFQSLDKNMAPARTARLLQEMNQWLKPGGGNVPEFHSAGELQTWWQANRQHYDQFLLRLDQ